MTTTYTSLLTCAHINYAILCLDLLSLKEIISDTLGQRKVFVHSQVNY